MKNSASDRLACVDLPALALQLLLKRRPEWRAEPAAVVAEDKPQGLILQVNERARRCGVLPGLRYAAGFSLARGLRAGAVAPAEIQQAVEALTRRLMRFTPEVEPSSSEAGVFWLNGAGLQRLYGSPQRWGGAVFNDIKAQELQASVVVGFSRFGTYGVAKAKTGLTVFNDPAEERNAARDVPLDRLDIEAKFRDILFKLGIRTVGGLLSLPAGGLRERFGVRAHRLHRMAAGDLWTPLEPAAPEEPVAQRYLLDDPEDDAARLLFLVKQLLHPMLAALAARAQALAALSLDFLIDRGEWLRDQIRPAEPTLEEAQILDLVRLRLESLQLAAGVIEIELTAEACAAKVEQLRLFAERPKRDLDAANRALARLRAEFGAQAVVRATLKDGHLPEAKFAWEPLTQVQLPQNVLNEAKRLSDGDGSNLAAADVLIRRITEKPILLAGGPYNTHEDGWLLLGPKHGSVDKLTGPFVYCGGWWNREIQRDYYFAETRRGDLLWLYYDRIRRRWFLQGAVE